ncbi:molybdopterin-synthase adenylyltransferase MoeB [Pilimelia terevasa]|nr:molybdopterin-synthase adenylyltransferase MoeB [Pilimelia terevasa]
MALPALVAPGAALTAAERRRYARQLTLAEVGEVGQRRLKNARVLCVGAGGLGSPVLLYLAAAGVGTIGVVDPDTVDESNLHRQVLHGQGDIGRAKTASAAAALAAVNPLVRVEPHPTTLDVGNARDLFAGYDLVVDGTDNFATRYLVNDAAVLLGKPYVWGSVLRFDGQASVFWAAHGPCYRCLYPEPPAPGDAPSCAEGGVLGVLCAAVGAVQATEAVKLVTGIGEPLVGRLLLHDALRMQQRTVALRRDPDCVLCGPRATQRDLLADYAYFCGVRPAAAGDTISPAALRDLRAAGGDPLVLDVREPWEHELVRLAGSVLLPLDRLLADPARVAELPADRRVVVHCKSGARSARALAALRAAGRTDAVHLDGGILAWIRDVDPTLPGY